jgi:hypothetical protein
VSDVAVVSDRGFAMTMNRLMTAVASNLGLPSNKRAARMKSKPCFSMFDCRLSSSHSKRSKFRL